MNKPRRKELEAIYDLICEACDRLDAVREEEAEYRDNIPENLQCSERYERADEIVNELEDAVYNLEEVIDAINNALE